MLDKIIYGGISDVGYKREINEDYISAIELGDHAIFAVVADGCGSKASGLQPGSIVTREIVANIRRTFEEDEDLLFDNAEFFLRSSYLNANQVLGAFKAGNEELYAGFGASVSCVLLQDNGGMAFAHVGNTRIYLIRQEKSLIQSMTVDHTKAFKLFTDGKISENDYYSHPDSLVLTSGLGIVADPIIQTYSGKIKEGDLLLISTDGIHYAIRPEPMAQLILQAENCHDAAQALIDGAKSQQYNDNMAAMLLGLVPQQS